MQLIEFELKGILVESRASAEHSQSTGQSHWAITVIAQMVDTTIPADNAKHIEQSQIAEILASQPWLTVTLKSLHDSQIVHEGS